MINIEKYEKIISELALGKKQSEITLSCACSYGTIQRAKDWDNSRKKTITISTKEKIIIEKFSKEFDINNLEYKVDYNVFFHGFSMFYVLRNIINFLRKK